MSILAKLQRTVARNRAKTLPFHPKRHPMKLEALEPRLLLTATDTQAQSILSTLSHYDMPLLPGKTLADIFGAEAKAEGASATAISVLEENDVTSISNGRVELDLGKFSDPIQVSNFGPLVFDSSTIAKFDIGADSHINFDYDTGANFDSSIEVKSNNISTLGSLNFGFLGATYASSNIDVSVDYDTNGKVSLYTDNITGGNHSHINIGDYCYSRTYSPAWTSGSVSCEARSGEIKFTLALKQ
ncbi:MAG: hypothetical protein PHC61_14370 [Chitinivibrionales bacterium]|nr:hypothetical protein [Chitinivibrionales bacterium]